MERNRSESYSQDDLRLLGRYHIRHNVAGRLVSMHKVPPEDAARLKERLPAMEEALQAVESIYENGGFHLCSLGRTLTEVPVPESDIMVLEQPPACDDIHWHWGKQKILNQDPWESIGRASVGPTVNGHSLRYVYPLDREMHQSEREQVMVNGWLLDTDSRRAFRFNATMEDAAFGCSELFQAISTFGSIESFVAAVHAYLVYTEISSITEDML